MKLFDGVLTIETDDTGVQFTYAPAEGEKRAVRVEPDLAEGYQSWERFAMQLYHATVAAFRSAQNEQNAKARAGGPK